MKRLISFDFSCVVYFIDTYIKSTHLCLKNLHISKGIVFALYAGRCSHEPANSEWELCLVKSIKMYTVTDTWGNSSVCVCMCMCHWLIQGNSFC